MEVRILLIVLVGSIFISCTPKEVSKKLEPDVFLVVLGVTQDGGYPQAGCNKFCCKSTWNGIQKPEKVTSLGLVDKLNSKVWLFDATPDFKEQLYELLNYLPDADINSVGGIFLTHAHIGHYTGLAHLGREAMGANQVPVFAMPKMRTFLEGNGPWSQLVNLGNIKIEPLVSDSSFNISDEIEITAIEVPHRDEYSETVGFKIQGGSKTAMFIPDIDKWDKWGRNIVHEVEKVDYAFLDATFYNDKELPDRDMGLIPHPFVSETVVRFQQSTYHTKNKIIFIHFNHTNPLLHNEKEKEAIKAKGYRIASAGDVFNLN